MGTAILPFLTSLFTGGFLGWGKPVMTNTSKLKGGLNGLALVALAGPASNVLMAVILAIVARATLRAAPAFADFAANGVELSLYLAIFNLLPVPPLDGSKILWALLPSNLANQFGRLMTQWGTLLLMLVVFTGTASKLIGPAVVSSTEMFIVAPAHRDTLP